MNTSVWFPPGATRRDWVADGVLAGCLFLFSTAVNLGVSQFDDDDAVLLVTSLLLCAPLVLRRHSPLLMMLAVTVAALVHLVTAPWPTFALVVVPIVSWSVARWVPGGASRWVLAVGVLGSILGPVRWASNGLGTLSATVTVGGVASSACLALVVTPYVLGRRSAEAFETRLRDRAASERRMQLEIAERDHALRLAEASTRSVIARELHDIVAHSLSVMIVQAEGGRAAALKHPEAAQQALDTIADTGRDALREMRRIVGVLRDGRVGADYNPAPTIADIPELVQRSTDRAQLVSRGTPVPMGPTLELTVYRLVQEALTNVLKHAGPNARATVTLVHEPSRIVVDVVDDGEGVENPPIGGGNGLRGMYERVTAMSGTLYAGSREDAPGFRVTAFLPITAPPNLMP